jgi:hypothetical protein
VFVGVGAALAKTERERRASRAKRARDRQFALLDGEQPAEGLTRMALAQLDIAIELLAGQAGPKATERAVHETRKSLKRLRTLMRLLEGCVEEQALAHEQSAVRDAAKRLAGARDAEVMLDTLDALLERHPRKLARRKGARKLRRRLLEEREQTAARAREPLAREETLAQLRGVRARIEAWTPRGGQGIEAIEPGLERVYRQGRDRYRQVARGKGERTHAMHQWRKRVKDLRYAAEALGRVDPNAKRGGRALKRGHRNAAAEKHARRLRMLARRADELGELLGEEHDLAVLAERIRAQRKRDAHGQQIGRGARRTLLKLIARRRRRHRKRALRKGARLYASRPKKFMLRMRQACR